MAQGGRGRRPPSRPRDAGMVGEKLARPAFQHCAALAPQLLTVAVDGRLLAREVPGGWDNLLDRRSTTSPLWHRGRPPPRPRGAVEGEGGGGAELARPVSIYYVYSHKIVHQRVETSCRASIQGKALQNSPRLTYAIQPTTVI